MSFWDNLRGQMMYLWKQFKSSSAIVKITVVTVAMIWLVACTMLMVALGFLMERPVVAQLPTPSPGINVPMISLEPTSGTLNTVVTVQGQGWTPGSTVFIYLAKPETAETGNFALNSTLVDAQGKFSVPAPILATQDWQVPGLVRVIARTAEGDTGAQAFFSLLEGPAQPTPTETSTGEPTQTSIPTVEQTPTATTTPQPGEPRLTTVTDLNIRSGPGTGYPILGLLRANQSARITGVSQDGRWWQIDFSGSNDDRGWVAAQFATAENTTNVPVVQAGPVPAPATPRPTPTPPATVTPVVITDWRGEYYNNPTMTGNPVFIRNDVEINYDWGRGSPASNVPADNFSARWTRSLYFGAGAYRFTVRADDGVLLWIDDRLIVDQWHDSSPRIYTADVNLTDGLHTVKMAYYERSGDAIAQLRWERLSTFPDWKGEYFNNPNLSGSPVVVRNDPAINFNWGSGSPAPGVPVDNFSVRWSRDVYFKAGTYRFTVKVDDGIRVWVDGNLVVDQWHDNDRASYVVEVNLPEGSRNVRVEYYEHGYEAIVQLEWAHVENFSDWKAEYFNNRRLQGDPVLVRNEDEIDHNWRTGSPSSEVPVDNFSARWTRRVDFDEGTYLFQVRVDDGVRLWIDDDLIIDSWQDGSVRVLEKRWEVDDGRRRVRLEYYDRSGDARIELDWEKQREQPGNKPPQADAGGPYTANEGAEVVLDGRDSRDPDGNIVLYEWDLDYRGNSFTADAVGPVVSTSFPDGPGTVTVALRVTDNRDARHVATARVNVQNMPPVADAGGPYSGRVDQPVTLTGTGRDAGRHDQGQLIYTWNFGDGSTGNGQTVTHRYAQAGSYNVTLTVTDKDGGRNSATTTVQINQANRPPQAVINGPGQGVVGSAIGFSGGSSTDNDGEIVKYAWNFGDGTTDTGIEASHTYSAPGNYTITLTVTDNGGLTGTTTKSIQIEKQTPSNQAPTAVINGPATGITGKAVSFSGGNSSDSDGKIVKYAWNFGDGATGNGVEVNHTYDAPGTYNIQLVVTDDGGSTGKTTKSIQIEKPAPENQPPTAVINGPARGVTGQAISFSGGSSSDSDGNIVKYAWNFGDGVTGNGVEVNHTYDAPGNYNVQLVVTDNGGLTGTTTKSIQIEKPAPVNVAPTAVITGPTTGVLGQVLTFNGSNSSDSDGTITGYSWDFGDGTMGNGAIITHTYTLTGNYQVVLTVTDNGGLSGSAGRVIQINQTGEGSPGDSNNSDVRNPNSPPPGQNPNLPSRSG